MFSLSVLLIFVVCNQTYSQHCFIGVEWVLTAAGIALIIRMRLYDRNDDMRAYFG